MALTLSRIDRIERTYDVTVTDANGTIPAPATAALAVLPVGTNPTSATVWTPVTVVNGSATALFAGPDADPTGAIVVAANAQLWLKSTATPEVDAVKVERITVLGGGTLPISAAQAADAAIAALLNDTTSATYAKVVALIAARAGFGNGNP